MNRRQFLKMAGIGGLAAMFLPLQIGDKKMEFGTLLKKIALNQSLSSEELQFLELEGRNTQLRNSFVAGNTTPQNALAVNFPLEVIYSEVLSDDKATLSIDIPPNYQSLMIMGGGRTDRVSYVNSINGTFNNDTGANYRYSWVKGDGSTPTAAQYSAQNFFSLADFPGTSAAAGIIGTFYSFIPHYRSALWKNYIRLGSNAGFDAGGNQLTLLAPAFWESSEAISSIQITPVSGNLLAGCLFSLYGLR